MKPEVVLVTPELASEWLKKNTSNRPLNEGTVTKYACQMIDGEWKDKTGDPVCFNCDGTLIDGQHRLAAMVEAKASYTIVVVRGVSKDAFFVKDIGRKRTAGDAMGVLGEANFNLLASALNVVYNCQSGWSGRNYTRSPGHATLAELLSRNPGVRASVSLVSSHGSELARIMPPGIIAGLHFMFASKDKDTADAFFSRIVSGQHLSEGDPELVLRDRMIRNKLSKSKLNRRYIAAITIKSWNARRLGRKVKTLKWGEEQNEDFPEII